LLDEICHMVDPHIVMTIMLAISMYLAGFISRYNSYSPVKNTPTKTTKVASPNTNKTIQIPNMMSYRIMVKPYSITNILVVYLFSFLFLFLNNSINF